MFACPLPFMQNCQGIPTPLSRVYFYPCCNILCRNLISRQAFLSSSFISIQHTLAVHCLLSDWNQFQVETQKDEPVLTWSVCMTVFQILGQARGIQSLTSIQWRLVNVPLSILSMNKQPCKWSISCWMIRAVHPLADHTTGSPLGSSPAKEVISWLKWGSAQCA